MPHTATDTLTWNDKEGWEELLGSMYYKVCLQVTLSETQKEEYYIIYNGDLDDYAEDMKTATITQVKGLPTLDAHDDVNFPPYLLFLHITCKSLRAFQREYDFGNDSINKPQIFPLHQD